MKKTILILSILFAIGLLFSCKSSKDVQTKGTPVNFTEIKTGANSSYSEYTTIEINSFKELSDVWVKLFSKYDRKPAIPTIDFDNNMLLTVALGERNNGSYSVKVKSVLETKNGITVVIEETKPGTTCNSVMSMIYPFQLIKIPKTNKSITFTKTSRIDECGKGF